MGLGPSPLRRNLRKQELKYTVSLLVIYLLFVSLNAKIYVLNAIKERSDEPVEE